MISLLLLLIIPLTIPLVSKWLYGRDITPLELISNMLIAAAIVTGGWFLGRHAQMADVQILNGEVISKNSERVSCEHSYSCNCVESCSTSSDGSKSCSTTCQTCYEHWYDVDWLVNGNIGKVKIPRADRRGLKEPEAWTRATIGEAMAMSENYTNFIKGAKNSLFNTLEEVQSANEYSNRIPTYPAAIYDHYRINRFIPLGVSVPNAAQWNQSISDRLKTMGPSKQVNLIVIITKESAASYGTALRAHWLNAKKNDVVVVLGAPQYPTVAWVEIMAWTDKAYFKVSLRDKLLNLGDASDMMKVLDTVQESIMHDYKRKPMSDYDYLKNEIEPPAWILAMLFVLGVIASAAAAYLFSKNNYRH